jgi:SpoVK/Ycf46/Vps4 family AAA+-type ATPase
MKNLMEADDKLTYSFLLSELSGIASAKNRVIVATTNFIDRIPEALKRPGRFDMVLYLTYFTRAEIIELLINIYGEQNRAKIIAQKYIENKFTPAVIIFNSSKTLNEMIKFLTTR